MSDGSDVGHSHYGQNLEEIVLGEILMRMMFMKRPKVVDEHVEYAKDKYEHDGAEFSLEAYNHHHACYESKDADRDPTNGPLPGEDESNEEEDEKYPTRELEVHLAVLFVDLRESSGRERLANPAVGQYHEKATHDGKVTEEKVEVKNQTVAEGLGYNDSGKTRDGLIGLLAQDDHGAANHHGNHITQEEEVIETSGN